MTDDTLRAAQPLTTRELDALRADLAASNGPTDHVGNAVFGGPEEAEEMAARLIATLDAALAASATEEPKPKRERIDWSNVVVDEGDEAP